MSSQIAVLEHLTRLFHRDLDRLKTELLNYKTASKLWVVKESISNCSGNLALHLVGNLNHFIGASMGNTGYVRQRDLEFSEKDVPLDIIIGQIEETKTMISSTLSQLNEEDLKKEFRRNPFEEYMTTEYFLLHLLTHLSYHLGQINYHRRLLDH